MTRVRPGVNRGESSLASCVVLPASAATPAPSNGSLARWLCGNLARLAERVCIPPATVAQWVPGDDRLFALDGQPLDNAVRPLLVANVSFLLRHDPPAGDIARKAAAGRVVVHGSRATGEVYAVGLPAGRDESLASLRRMLLAELTRPGGGEDRSWLDGAGFDRIDAEGSGTVGTKSPSARRATGPFGTAYVNRALYEVLEDSRRSRGGGAFAPSDDPAALAQSLVAQRDRSTVPWLFNSLANEVEHGAGYVRLASFPQELHLSLTGRCNIECQFCTYAHAQARSDFVEASQVARLTGLRHMRYLRLSSGLGEPTLNPHLADILDLVFREHPHLEVNFFTNGVLLDRPGLADRLVGRAHWINVSLNAATRETWNRLCSGDQFDRVCGGLRRLARAKAEAACQDPAVRGSLVLTAPSIAELPQMPRLCRELGIEYLTAIPFSSLGYPADRLRGPDTLHAHRDEYDRLYDRTVEEAARHGIAIELPPPSGRTAIRYGLEVRSHLDFSRAARRQPAIGRLLSGDPGHAPPSAYCPEVWRNLYVGSTTRKHRNQEATHFAYPCLGPVGSQDLSPWTAFDFPSEESLLAFWNGPLQVSLRRAQVNPGTYRICDFCRRRDSRDPAAFPGLEVLLQEWRDQQAPV